MRCHRRPTARGGNGPSRTRRKILFQHNNRLSLCCFRCVCTLAIAKPIHSISNIQMSHCSYVPLTRTSCRRPSLVQFGRYFVVRTENRNLAVVRFLGKTFFVPRFANFTKPLSGFFFPSYLLNLLLFSRTKLECNWIRKVLTMWFGLGIVVFPAKFTTSVRCTPVNSNQFTVLIVIL